MKKILIALALLSGVAHAQNYSAQKFRLMPQATTPIGPSTDVFLWSNSANSNHPTLHLGGADYDLLYTLGGLPVSTSVPNTGQRLSFNGSVWHPITGRYNVQDFGAVCDGVTDDTAAFQACANKGAVICELPPTPCYIAGTITMHQGTTFEGTAGPTNNQAIGSSVIHGGNNINLFVWDGNATSSARGVGGGLKNMYIAKQTGKSGGDAVYLVGTDDGHRPGEMLFQNVDVGGEDNSAYWSRVFHLDGTANNTPSGRGVRSVHMNKFRAAACDDVNYHDQCIYLNQPTHFFGTYVQIDFVGGTGTTVGMTIAGNFDQVFLSPVEINGDVVVNQPPDNTYFPNFFFQGRAGSSFVVNATTVTGNVDVVTASLTNNSTALGVRNAGSSSTYSENQTVTGSWKLQHAVSDAVDTSVQLYNPTPATSGAPRWRSPGLMFTGNLWNTTSLASNTEQFLLQVLPNNGSAPSGTLGFFSNENGGGWTSRMLLQSNGQLDVSGNLYTGNTAGNGHVYADLFDTNTAGDVPNFCTGGLASSCAFGNSSTPVIIAASTFDLTRVTAISGTPTWNSSQTFPGLTSVGTLIESESTSNGINTAVQLNTSTTASAGTPIARSVGLVETASVWDPNLLAASSVQFIQQTLGTNVSGTPGLWILASNIAGAGWTTQLSVTSAGVVTASGDIYTNGSSGNGTVHALVFNPSTPGTGNFCTGNCTQVSIGDAGAPVVFAGSNFDLSRMTGTFTFPSGVIGDSALASTFNKMSTGAIGDLLYATGTAAGGVTRLADVAAGSFLRSGGTSTAPAWSTTTWPNSATTGDIIYASGTNAIGNIADVATGSVLVSGGAGVAPAWSATPTLTSLTVTEGTGTQTGLVAATAFSNMTPVSSVTTGQSDGQSYTMPANTLSANGQMLVIHSYGLHAANTNSSTFGFLIFNGVAVNSITTTTSNDVVSSTCYITRLTSSTAQYQCITQAGAGFTNNRGVFNSLNFAASIVIKNTVTGATSNGDMVANGLRVEWFSN